MNQTASQDNPYAAPSANLADAYFNEGLALAERLTRLFAVLLDTVVVFIAAIPLFVFMTLSMQGKSATLWAMLGGLAVLALSVYNLFLLYQSGQTIGKKLLGIKILRTDGSRCSLPRIIFMRSMLIGILGGIPFIGPLISLTDVLLIFRDNRLCLHDQIADTIVVKV
jgi:uncharacterized RDD family membrane protein YckC